MVHCTLHRADLSRTAHEVAEKSGFDFDIVYDFLWNVIAKNHSSVRKIREKIKAIRGKIYIDDSNQLYLMTVAAGGVICGAGADYWEDRILARQEA